MTRRDTTMGSLSFRNILIAAVLAGLAAGLVAGAFHFIATEPLMDYAIQLEQQLAQPAAESQAAEEPIVSRDGQKAGLILGFLIYGLGWGLLFSVVFHILRGSLARLGSRQGIALLVFLIYWSLVLVPFLKYPANPPGVGEATTVAYRQQLYLSMLLLSAAGTGAALFIGRLAARRLQLRRGWLPPLSGLILVAAGLYLLMPASPDPVRMPEGLVLHFRLLALGGLTLFWATFGLCFSRLALRPAGKRPATRTTQPGRAG